MTTTPFTASPTLPFTPFTPMKLKLTKYIKHRPRSLFWEPIFLNQSNSRSLSHKWASTKIRKPYRSWRVGGGGGCYCSRGFVNGTWKVKTFVRRKLCLNKRLLEKTLHFMCILQAKIFGTYIKMWEVLNHPLRPFSSGIGWKESFFMPLNHWKGKIIVK